MMKKPRLRFQINWEKAIEAVEFLARHRKGITQYYVGKICYFADKEHLLDYGRPVTGDRYVAMEHGPVPSSIRDILKKDYGVPDDVLEEFHKRVHIHTDGNKQHMSSTGKKEFKHLSGSDQEYLLAALNKYGSMSFGELREISHDEAWAEAWEVSEAYEMNPATWLNELEANERNSAIAYLSDRRVRLVH